MSEITEKNQRWITYFLGFIVSVLAVFILITFKHILIPVTIAILLTYLFHPLLELLKEKLKIPRPIGLVLIFILNFAVFYVLGLFSFPVLVVFLPEWNFMVRGYHKLRQIY